MALYEDLRPVIQLIDNLKDCGIESKISLPRITVIGTQSAGKSSLLESIVGLDFLPRGDGVVTRRPLELRLIHLDDEEAETYAEFADEPGVQYADFTKVTERIETKTNAVAGQKKGIVDDPITLTVYAKECPTLTLIDLPGITRVPLKGSDQPENIEEITTNMAMRFIKDERTIILCVIPANHDISTSDSLKLAKKVDPDGKRTLGVLTKVDIMDKGTSILPVLKNDIIHLTHGYVAVKNRSQADIKNQMKVQTALEIEKEYFESHRELRNCLDLVGTHVLSTKLSTLLHTHIIHCLPAIEKEIQDSLLECEANLRKLGDAFPTDKGQKLYYLMSRAREVAADVRDITEGKKLMEDKNRKFQGYAYFNLLMGKFTKDKNELFINGLKALSPAEVILDLVELKGLALPGLLPKEIIEKQVKSRLNALKTPTYQFIHEMKVHNSRIIKSIFDSMLSVSGEAKKLLQRVSLEFLERQAKDTEDFIDRMIEVEKDMIWTSDQNYFLKENSVTSQISSLSNHEHTNGYGLAPTQDHKLNKSLNFIKQELPSFDYTTILNIPQGSIRATVLVETIVAVFQMDEILYELRNHSSGLNCGRWDYIFSYIKKFRNHPKFVVPDRSSVGMTTPFMAAYVKLLVRTCHRRGAHAMGGMAAQIPVKNDPELNNKFMAAVTEDKSREVAAGHDGTWVAHPGLVKIALDAFSKMSGPNQISYIPEAGKDITAAQLIEPPTGAITYNGLVENIDVSLVYTEAWLRGSGCIPLHNKMEDAATAEISRAQVWQWIRHSCKTVEGKTVTKPLVLDILKECVNKRSLNAAPGNKWTLGGEIMGKVLTGDDMVDFLTLPCYPRIVQLGSSI